MIKRLHATKPNATSPAPKRGLSLPTCANQDKAAQNVVMCVRPVKETHFRFGRGMKAVMFLERHISDKSLMLT
jgi:hypothetical protein